MPGLCFCEGRLQGAHTWLKVGKEGTPTHRHGDRDGIPLMRSLTLQALGLGSCPLPLPERWFEAGICSPCEAEVRVTMTSDLAVE